MKKWTRSLLAGGLALVILLGLAACGAASGGKNAASADTSAETPMEAPAETNRGYEDDASEVFQTDMGAGADTGSEVLRDQKMIYTGELSLETTAFDDAARALLDLVESMGGYLESSSVGGGGYRWAHYTVRVPSEQFQSFLTQAGGLAHEVWRSTDTQNITEMYYDTQGRLTTQQVKLERLQELLKKAQSMEDIITIESAISETEQTIESLSGTMRHYDAEVNFSTVEVQLEEVYKLSNTQEAPQTFGQRLQNAVTDGWAAFTDGMENFAVALAYSWMWVILLAAAAFFIGRVLGRRLRRKKQGKLTEETADKPPKT